LLFDIYCYLFGNFISKVAFLKLDLKYNPNSYPSLDLISCVKVYYVDRSEPDVLPVESVNYLEA